MKFRVGDRVRVNLDDLEDRSYFSNGIYINDEMRDNNHNLGVVTTAQYYGMEEVYTIEFPDKTNYLWHIESISPGVLNKGRN